MKRGSMLYWEGRGARLLSVSRQNIQLRFMRLIVVRNFPSSYTERLLSGGNGQNSFHQMSQRELRGEPMRKEKKKSLSLENAERIRNPSRSPFLFLRLDLRTFPPDNICNPDQAWECGISRRIPRVQPWACPSTWECPRWWDGIWWSPAARGSSCRSVCSACDGSRTSQTTSRSTPSSAGRSRSLEDEQY